MKPRYQNYLGTLALLLGVGLSTAAMANYLDRSEVDANVLAFHALDNSNIVYVLGSDRKLWREFGNAWAQTQPRQLVDGNVLAFLPVDSHIVYVLGRDGKLWREFDNAWNVQKPRRL
jgi:hypothetical protein